MTSSKMQRRVQISSVMVCLGLIIELVSLLWSTPTAFLFFLMPGALLMAAGILLYLFSLVTVSSSTAEPGGINSDFPS